jgi:hypothetical protein
MHVAVAVAVAASALSSCQPEPSPLEDPSPEPATPRPEVTPPEPGGPLRFAVIGDTGQGNTEQFAVADAMARVCSAHGCDFVLLVGDNLYPSGATSVDDPQWDEKFEIPYAGFELPFWAALGNHDWGNYLNEARADVQVAYTAVSPRFRMPARHYAWTRGNASFLALDTQPIVYAQHRPDDVESQEALVEELWGEPREPGEWRFAFGHHPYLSSGRHGDAGFYDGYEPHDGENSGIFFRRFMEDHVCGRADAYFCGHDHDRQWLVETCQGTQLIVSGAGSKLRTFRGSHAQWFADDQDEGFVRVEIDGERAIVQFWNSVSEMEYEGAWER